MTFTGSFLVISYYFLMKELQGINYFVNVILGEVPKPSLLIALKTNFFELIRIISIMIFGLSTLLKIIFLEYSFINVQT